MQRATPTDETKELELIQAKLRDYALGTQMRKTGFSKKQDEIEYHERGADHFIVGDMKTLVGDVTVGNRRSLPGVEMRPRSGPICHRNRTVRASLASAPSLDIRLALYFQSPLLRLTSPQSATQRYRQGDRQQFQHGISAACITSLSIICLQPQDPRYSRRKESSFASCS